MKNINDITLNQSQQSGAALTNGFNGAKSNSKDLGALQKRQSDVIKQLEQLRQKLNEMQTKLGVSNVPMQSKSAAPIIKPIDERYLQDIVIHVNPANTPFSLLGLQKLWANRLNFVIECYTHSSIKQLAGETQQFVKRLGEFKSNPKLPTLRLSLIWKETSSTDLVCAPGTFIPISGEANILRYLIRIGPSEFGYIGTGSIQANLEIDALFDIIYELQMASGKDHRSSILKRLSQRLNIQTAFGGNSTNVSDLAVFSTLKQIKLTAKELPDNVKTWFERNKQLIQV